VLVQPTHIAKTYQVQMRRWQTSLCETPCEQALDEGDDFFFARNGCPPITPRGNAMRAGNVLRKARNDRSGACWKRLGIEVLRLVVSVCDRFIDWKIGAGPWARESPEAECCGKGGHCEK